MSKLVHKYSRNLREMNKGFRPLSVSLFALMSLWPVNMAHAEIVNTVTAGGTFNGNTVTSPSDTESVDVVDAISSISVAKTSDVVSVSAAGDDIVYSVTATNDGNVTATAITVTDTLLTLVCPTSGNNTIASLAPAANEICTATYTTLQADLDLNGANDGGPADGDIDNTASASGTASGTPVSDSDTNAVTLTLNPGLSVAKSADTAGPVNAGDVITYTFVVTNTGNVTITNVRVDDTHNGSNAPLVVGSETLTTDALPLLDSTDAAANGVWDTIAPGDIVTFTATYTVTQTDVDTLQ